MIARLKQAVKRHWPSLRLRTILFGTLLFTAALPGVGALFLRVYENTLVRQTEAELIAQGAALAAAAQTLWPGAIVAPVEPDYRPEASRVDLRSSPILPERPAATRAAAPPDPALARLLPQLTPIVATTANTTLASIQLIDRNGTIALGYEGGRSYAGVPEVAGALKGRVGTVLRNSTTYRQRYAFEWLSRASSLRIHHVRPIVVNGRVVGAVLLSRSPRALFRGLYEDRGKIILGVVLIFLTLLGLTALLSRGIARPIEALGRATRAVAEGGNRTMLPETPATAAIEIRGLFEDFRAMAAAIERRSRYLRDFAASVSHEFKTPLAGIAGSIELLEDHGATMAPAERARFLGNIKADTARLSQLVTRLLDLARADMAAAQPHAETDLAAVVRSVADAFDEEAFRVALAMPDDMPRAAMPQATLDAVLGTLLANAKQAGAARATVELRNGADGPEMRVTDDGPGIPAGDRERIFEPFFTTRRTTGGTGLGLAISRSLLRAGGGTLTLDPDHASGARFVVTLPAASSDPSER